MLADPQLHNFLGGRLKSMSRLAAVLLTRVARRPAVLNVLGQLVLEAFVDQLARRLADSPAPLMLVLGDAANISCTNEFDRFTQAMVSSNEKHPAWLAVHGNHDSFMMGNISSYQRVTEWGKPEEAKGVLWQESRWSPKTAATYAYEADDPKSRTSWAQACASPGLDSAPMTKAMWLRRYLIALEQQDVRLKRGEEALSAKPDTNDDTPFNGARCAPPFRFEGTAAEGSILAARNFWLTGEWRPRDRVLVPGYAEDWDERCPNGQPSYDDADTHEWGAFVVQSVDLGEDTTGILVDTSIREQRVDSNDLSEFPGLHGGLGELQLAEIERHRCRARERGRKVVFVGHHPWKDLPEDERKSLSAGETILYLSGHTHLESSLVIHGEPNAGFPELNIGSVMDWPMEAALLSVTSRRVLWKLVGLHHPDEGNLRCRGKSIVRSYEPLFASRAAQDCRSWVDRQDRKTPRRALKEHQVPRTERALQFMSRHGLGPSPIESSAPTRSESRENAARLGNIVDGIVASARTDTKVRELGIDLARCAARDVLAQPLNHSGTCPRREEPGLVAASSLHGISLAGGGATSRSCPDGADPK